MLQLLQEQRLENGIDVEDSRHLHVRNETLFDFVAVPRYALDVCQLLRVRALRRESAAAAAPAGFVRRHRMNNDAPPPPQTDRQTDRRGDGAQETETTGRDGDERVERRTHNPFFFSSLLPAV